MNNLIYAEAGEPVFSVACRARALAKELENIVIFEHNGIRVMVSPESCLDDILLIWELKWNLVRERSKNG